MTDIYEHLNELNIKTQDKKNILRCSDKLRRFTVKSRYYATSLLCHSRYYTNFDRPQQNSTENKSTMPRETYGCTVL